MILTWRRSGKGQKRRGAALPTAVQDAVGFAEVVRKDGREFGLRRQSAAATALSPAREPHELPEASRLLEKRCRASLATAVQDA